MSSVLAQSFANFARARWIVPSSMIVACTIVGLALEDVGAIYKWYATPYVLAVLLTTLLYGRGMGYLAAAISGAVWHTAFSVQQSLFEWPNSAEWVSLLSMLAVVYVTEYARRQAPATRRIPFSGSLPFVGRKIGSEQSAPTRSFWAVEASGDWVADCVVGEVYARLWLDRCATGGAPLLCWIVRDMIQAGQYSGVEAGFLGVVTRSSHPDQPTDLTHEHANERDIHT